MSVYTVNLFLNFHSLKDEEASLKEVYKGSYLDAYRVEEAYHKGI